MNHLPVRPVPAAEISDRELALSFESLGDNCELGLVQRRVGAEPLGLLRFAGVPLTSLLHMLDARFEGLADPENIRVQPENGEYMIRLTKYDMVYHAHVKIGQIDPEALRRQQSRTLRFLADKLIADLEAPTKILVFRQNEPLLASDLIDLRSALARYGRSTLLWVQAARPGHPPGAVDRIDDTLLAGYVRRLAEREAVPELDVTSWLTMLRRAHGLQQATPMPAVTMMAEPSAEAAGPLLQAVFGAGGNAVAHVGYGWSAPEDGFTWSIDDRSLLTFPAPLPADEYWLDMDVVPYVSAPVLPSQRLAVRVNGELVDVFDPVPRGRVACAVPGRLMRARDTVEILLEHPNAARPCEIAGEKDDRRLAVAFRRLSLSAAPAP